MPCGSKRKKKSSLKGQMGFEISFVLMAIFYLAFVTMASALWPGASGVVTGGLSLPALPTQPGILEYLSFAISSVWFYLVAFFAFNIAIPVIGLITLTMALGMAYVVAKVIRGT